MSTADRLEAAGVVVGCSILLAVPTAALIGIFVDAVILPVRLSLLALVPGLLAGLLVLRSDRLAYAHVWRFGLTAWLAAFVLWGAFDVSQEDTATATALAAWLGAVVVGLLAATADRWRPTRRG